MKLRSLRLRNFRLHSDTTIGFPPEGILGILGTNESGKSTILEAIIWALFGAKATRGTKEAMRWFRAVARQVAAVTLVFEIGGIVYKLIRSENSAELHILVPKPQLVAKGTAAVNEHIPKLLGMTLAEFISSFMVKQKDVEKLQLMQPVDRVAFIRSIMGMGKIDTALAAVRKQKSVLSAERDGMILGLGERYPLVEDANRAEEAVKEALGKTGAAVLVADDLMEALRVDKVAFDASAETEKEHGILVAVRDRGALAVRTGGIESGRLADKLVSISHADERLKGDEALVSTLPQLRRDKDAMLIERGRIGERKLLTAASDRVRDQILHSEELIEDHNNQIGLHDEDVWTAATRAAHEADKAHDVLVDARNARYTELKVQATVSHGEAERVRGLLGILDAAGDDGTCPTCLRALGDVFVEVRGAMHAELLNHERDEEALNREASTVSRSGEEIEADLTRVEAFKEAERQDQLRYDCQRATDNVKRDTPVLAEQRATYVRHRTSLKAMPPAGHYDANEYTTLERSVARITAIETKMGPDRALASQQGETRDLLSAQDVLTAEAQEVVDKADAALLALGFDLDEHSALEADHDGALEDYRGAKTRLAVAREGESHSGQTLLRAQRALDAYDVRAVNLEEVSAEHLLHEKTAAKLADFRVAIATTLRPEMEELMSGFVNILTDGRHESVELSEDFDAILYENGIAVEVVSGGTEDIAALAMRLALSQMIAERAGHPLSLLILDEPFGSLDENRRGNVLTLIRRLSGVFSQVVVISHVAETRDAVDHVLELEFNEGAGCSEVVSATYQPEEEAA